MTGDGANDSGALKAGDIGISIAAKESLSVDSSGTNQISPEEVSNAHLLICHMFLSAKGL